MWLKSHKSLIMPLSMILGALFYNPLSKLPFLIPFGLFCMLFIAYSSLNFRRLRITKTNIVLIICHLILILGLYFIAKITLGNLLALSVILCVISPTSASSSAVVFSLGGSKETCITHIILDNIFVTIFAPIILSILVPTADVPIFTSMIKIFNHIMPLLILPLVIVIFIRRLKPKITAKIAEYQWTSLIFWSLCLLVIFAQTTDRIIHCNKEELHQVIIMATTALIICIFQYIFGNIVGKRLHNQVAVAQGLGQKNTSLGIWLANAYSSNPLAIIFSAAYSLWQNIYNSWQMYDYERKQNKKEIQQK